MTDDPIAVQRRLRKAFALADEIGMTDDERHDIALFITGEQDSWKRLDGRQLDKLLNMIEGYIHITYLFDSRTA